MPIKVSQNENISSVIDCVLQVEKEKIPGNGEDSYLFSVKHQNAIVGVFDGCGGSGSRKYSKLGGKSGAYLASRIVSGVTLNWFSAFDNNSKSVERNICELKKQIVSGLKLCNDIGGEQSLIKGNLAKEFPTTLALTVSFIENSKMYALCVWAGDSRCYLLNEEGLMQLTEDDVDGFDAMENLSADGVLRNVISYSNDFILHSRLIEVSSPCVLFTATDGCFGYFATPMEFEYLLINTLTKSVYVREWEERMESEMELISGDDFSLCGLVIGYKSFDNLKSAFANRVDSMYRKYIKNINKKSLAEKKDLWIEYKKKYSAFLEK